VAVTAGAVDAVLLLALRTEVDAGAQFAGSAGADGAQDLLAVGRNARAEAQQVLRSIAPDDLREGGHGRRPASKRATA
jgi:hypothetical protein